MCENKRPYSSFPPEGRARRFAKSSLPWRTRPIGSGPRYRKRIAVCLVTRRGNQPLCVKHTPQLVDPNSTFICGKRKAPCGNLPKAKSSPQSARLDRNPICQSRPDDPPLLPRFGVAFFFLAFTYFFSFYFSDHCQLVLKPARLSFNSRNSSSPSSLHVSYAPPPSSRHELVCATRTQEETRLSDLRPRLHHQRPPCPPSPCPHW